ncbi:MAG: SulP family inorganic anion transporter [Desulfobulbaceae bacterium]|nr:SulP family inorganic anion transporter [Desulfobulbaceae bacterium]
MQWLPMVNKQTLRSDFIAGLTGAVVVLPQGVAFANIAGMPPEYGLYAGMVPAIIAAFFGSSWHLVSGPTTAASIVILSSLTPFAEPTTSTYVALALTLTFMVGVIELIMGLARMGELVNFISHSVIVGFTAGAACLIGGKQLKNFFGVPIPRGGHFHDILYNFYQQIPNINWYATTVGMVTLLSGILIKRLWPRLPHLIISMVCGIIAAMGLNGFFGVETCAIGTIGSIPRSLPPLSAPMLSMDTFKQLSVSALAITLFALTEAFSISRSMAMRTGQRISGNQEFIGQGLSNIVGSFFSGYVATGSFNRSGLNYQAGAKTPLAAMLAGLLLMGIVLLLAPYSDYIPNAAMAGLLFLVAWGLIDFKAIKHILHTSRRETTIFGVTIIGALFFELEMAIFAGVILSLILYLQRVAHPTIKYRVPNPRSLHRKFTTNPSLPECPQLKFIRVDGSLFFGSVSYVQEALAKITAEYPEQKHLAIVATGIHFADIAGSETLGNEAKQRRNKGGELYVINAKSELLDCLEKSRDIDTIGAGNFFGNKSSAIIGIMKKLDNSICKQCTKRIFLECSNIPTT